MKNQTVVEELKKLNPEDYVEIRLQLNKKSLVEVCYHSGTKFNKKFSCDSETLWRTAEAVTESMTVSDIMEILEEKSLDELCDLHFDGLTLEESTDGSVEVTNIEWEEPLTEEEEIEFTSNDLYWDSEITDSEVQFSEGAIYSMTIKCGDYETQVEE